MIVNSPFIARYSIFFASLIIYLTAAIGIVNFPAAGDYRTGADEGSYYRQGSILANEGFSGFKHINAFYQSNVAFQDAPVPLRIVAYTIAACALKISDSYVSLSVLSLSSMILLMAATFLFFKRYFSPELALMLILLMAVSPLELAMSRRALMDMPAMLAMALSCYVCWIWQDTGKTRYLFAMILLLVGAILLKEANVILLPFLFATLCIQKFYKRTPITWLKIFTSIASVPLICVLVWITIFGYQNWISTLKIIQYVASNSAYSALWGKGPWYRIPVDYILLSPFTTLTSLFFLGYYLLTARKVPNDKLDYMVFLMLYLLVCYSLLPMNVRYTILMDLPIRLMAACGLLILFKRWRKLKVVPAFIMLVLLGSDLSNFYRYFIIGGIYDPVSFNLLEKIHIIPNLIHP